MEQALVVLDRGDSLRTGQVVADVESVKLDSVLAKILSSEAYRRLVSEIFALQSLSNIGSAAERQRSDFVACTRFLESQAVHPYIERFVDWPAWTQYVVHHVGEQRPSQVVDVAVCSDGPASDEGLMNVIQAGWRRTLVGTPV
jgi:hypothetical protein